MFILLMKTTDYIYVYVIYNVYDIYIWETVSDSLAHADLSHYIYILVFHPLKDCDYRLVLLFQDQNTFNRLISFTLEYFCCVKIEVE